MYLVADILVVLIIVMMTVWGIKKGFLRSVPALVWVILGIALTLGSAFALAFFIFDWTGWLSDVQMALIDFAQGFMGLCSLIGLEITTAEIAKYIAYGVITLILVVPMGLLWFWVGRLISRFIDWLRNKFLAVKIVSSVFGGVCTFAIGAAVVFGFILVASKINPTSYLMEVLRSGYITNLFVKVIELLGI